MDEKAIRAYLTNYEKFMTASFTDKKSRERKNYRQVIRENVARAEKVLMENTVPLIKFQLGPHLPGPVAGGENLEHRLGGDAVLFPLKVGSPVSLGPAQGHHHIRAGAGVPVTLRGIPEQVRRHEHVGIVPEQNLQPLLDHHYPFVLPCVLRHGLPVALRIENVVFGENLLFSQSLHVCLLNPSS